MLVSQAESEPDKSENWGKLGMTLLIHDYIEPSVPCFEKANSLDPEHFRWPYFCAIALDELNSDDALIWYEKAKQLDSSYPPLNIKLGNRYLLSGRLKEAKACYQGVLYSNSRVPHAYLGLAKVAMEQSDLDAAESQISKAVQMAPGYREAQALLADIYRRKGEKEKAELVFNKMVKLPERLDLKDPVYYEMVNEAVSSFWCQVRGNNFLNQGNLNKAEEEFKKALEAKPNEASHTSLGYVYQRQKRYEAAMDHYKEALDINPVHFAAINNLAVIYFELGDIEKAKMTIMKSLEIDSKSTDAYLNIGTFSKRQGQRADAINYFKKGMEIAPNDRRFAYQLARIYASAPESKIRNGKEALRLAVLICEDNEQETATCLDLLAMGFAENKEYDKARQLAERAHSLAIKNRDKQMAQEIEPRIDLYKSQKPYRENN